MQSDSIFKSSCSVAGSEKLCVQVCRVTADLHGDNLKMTVFPTPRAQRHKWGGQRASVVLDYVLQGPKVNQFAAK